MNLVINPVRLASFSFLDKIVNNSVNDFTASQKFCQVSTSNIIRYCEYELEILSEILSSKLRSVSWLAISVNIYEKDFKSSQKSRQV